MGSGCREWLQGARVRLFAASISGGEERAANTNEQNEMSLHQSIDMHI